MPPLMYCSIGVVPEMCPITHIQARRSRCMQQCLAKSIYRAPEFAKGMKWAANADCFLLWLSAALLPLFSVGLALWPCLIILVQFSNFEILGFSWLISCGIIDPFAEAKLWLLKSLYIYRYIHICT